jgi:hypothetical protein
VHVSSTKSTRTFTLNNCHIKRLLLLLHPCKQEALLYEPWEAAVLRHPGFEPVTCPDSGRLLFAGPRLRMGLAEGAPHSVAPDHSGRANYAVSCTA